MDINSTLGVYDEFYHPAIDSKVYTSYCYKRCPGLTNQIFTNGQFKAAQLFR